MVANAEVTEQIELELESLRLMMADLTEIADEWPTLSGTEQASWGLDWDQVMGALEVVLVPRYGAGQMTPSQQVRYGALVEQLQNLLPLVERLGLSTPVVRSAT